MALPFWKVKESRKRVPGWLIIRCPRTGCRRFAIVKKSWLEGDYDTRPCTYCFKTARIPDDHNQSEG